MSAEWLVPHLAFPTVHNKHIQREFVQSVEGMRLADIQVQIALHAHVPSSHRCNMSELVQPKMVRRGNDAHMINHQGLPVLQIACSAASAGPQTLW